MVQGLPPPKHIVEFMGGVNGMSETADIAKAMHDTSRLADQKLTILEVGQRVRVRGLTKQTKLNSKYGVIATAPTKDGGRYGVIVEFIMDDPSLGPGGQSLMIAQDPLAIKRDNLEVAPPRLPHGVLCASTYGRLDEVTAYLNAGGDIEALRALPTLGMHPPKATQAYALTPLTQALHALHHDTLLMNSVNTPHVNIVVELLRRGASVNYIGKGSTTALHMAAFGGRKQSVKLLLEARARTDLQSDKGLVAAEEAEQQGHFEVAEIIRQATHP
jgi:hypothetical protein